MTATPLLLAVITFFLIAIVINCINSYYFLILLAFMNVFIALSITPIFDPTDTFSAASINGLTELEWLELLYGSLVLLSLAKVWIRIAGSKKHGNAMTED